MKVTRIAVILVAMMAATTFGRHDCAADHCRAGQAGS